MKLLVAVAHPDDETFGCGSVLAHASARGVESVVVCATRGELGGPSPGLPLGRRREAELRRACRVLGVGRVEVLGYPDGGVDAAVQEPIAALLDEEEPDVVVTLDASDGHPDHAAVRDATLRAVAGRDIRTYLWCLPRSLMTQFTGDPSLGTPDEEITTTIDVSSYLPLRWEAMRAHASQVPPYASMSPELADAFLTVDRLKRVWPAWDAAERGDDWIERSSVASPSPRSSGDRASVS
jgi:LmbE family N-acetylglucosaminyl deacetylase